MNHHVHWEKLTPLVLVSHGEERSRTGDRRELAFWGRDARTDPERRHASLYETIAQIRGTFSWKLNSGYRLPRASCGNGQYTPPTSNSLGRSRERERTWIALLSYGRAVVPHARTYARSTRTRYSSSSWSMQQTCNNRYILNPF